MQVRILVVLLAALAIAGCSSGSDGTVPPKDAQGRYVVHMTAASQFDPPNAKIPVGAVVVWKNDADIHHDVMSDDGSFTSGSPGGLEHAGSEYTFTLAHAGTFRYHCSIHHSTGMAGTLVVA